MGDIVRNHLYYNISQTATLEQLVQLATSITIIVVLLSI